MPRNYPPLTRFAHREVAMPNDVSSPFPDLEHREKKFLNVICKFEMGFARGAVALPVERPSKVPVWCNSAAGVSNHA